MTPPLTDLISRLERASEGSAELDAEIARALGGEAAWQCRGWRVRQVPGLDWSSGPHWKALPRWTASLDDALALVEAVRPGWFWTCGRSSCGWARVIEPYKREFYAEAATPALAVLLALLRSLEAAA